MNNVPENELFSAYLDGELTAEEQAQIERSLAASPQARQLLEELRALSSTLQSLPVHKLDEDLSQRVLRLAERQMLMDPSEQPASRDTLQSEPFAWRPSLRRLLRPRNLLFPGIAVAIALVFVLTDRSGENRPGAGRVAMAPRDVREEAQPTPEEPKPAENFFIGPAREPGGPIAGDAVETDKASKADDAIAGRADGKVAAASSERPALSSTAANVMPSAGGMPAGAPAPATSTANMVVGMPSAPALAAPAPAEKAAKESLGRPMSAAAGAALSLKGQADRKEAGEPPADAAKRDRVAAASKLPDASVRLKGMKAGYGAMAGPTTEPTLVVLCDVREHAAARGLLEQVLAKQQIAMGKPIDAFKAGGGYFGMGGASGSASYGFRRAGQSVQPAQVPPGAPMAGVPSRPADKPTLWDRGKTAPSERFAYGVELEDGQRRGEVRLAVEATPDQLHLALTELKAHPKVFASLSVEPQAMPYTPGQMPDRLGTSVEQQRVAPGSQPQAGKGPGMAGGPEAPPVVGTQGGWSFNAQGGQVSRGVSRAAQAPVIADQSQTPVPSQMAEQTAPMQQIERGTPSRSGFAQSVVGPRELKSPVVAEAQAESGKQRVLFVLRFALPDGPEAADVADAKKAKSAMKLAEPAKPAPPAAAAPTAPAVARLSRVGTHELPDSPESGRMNSPTLESRATPT